MNILNRDDLAVLYRLTNPPLLLLSVALYGLGAAIARFLGQPVPPERFMLGLLLVLLVQISCQLLTRFFAAAGDRMDPGRKLPLLKKEGLSSFSLRALFLAAAGGLTLAATLAGFLMLSGQLAAAAAIILLVEAMLALSYGTPPLRLQTSGYGELLVSFLLAAGLPAFAYSLFTGELHRLILMSTAPLVGVLFSVQIALSLVRYGEHAQQAHRNLTVRLGWQQAMRLHDVSLLLSFLALALAFSFGLPPRVAIGSFMVLPLAILQIWYLSRVRAGAPVRWGLLGFNSHALVGLMTYLELAGYLL